MDENEFLAKRFEEHRSHLRAVAYRMLGSLSEADDAVQEAWLRLSRSETSGIENLGGWLTTVVGRVCLDMLRSRTSRRVVPLGEPLGTRVPEPLVSRADGIDPVVGRSPTAARQLASRARRRVQGEAHVPDADLATQREVVDAFLAASRDGDFDTLLAVLDPDVVLRMDGGAVRAGLSREVRGARAVAEQTLTFSRLSPFVRPALVNGAAGVVVAPRGRPFSVMGFTIRGGKIVEVDILADPARLSRLDVSVFDD